MINTWPGKHSMIQQSDVKINPSSHMFLLLCELLIPLKEILLLSNEPVLLHDLSVGVVCGYCRPKL